jgi:hypothetical protein
MSDHSGRRSAALNLLGQTNNERSVTRNGERQQRKHYRVYKTRIDHEDDF